MECLLSASIVETPWETSEFGLAALEPCRLNLAPSSILRPSRVLLIDGLRNPSSISSNALPLVSGMNIVSMMTVNKDRPPNRK